MFRRWNLLVFLFLCCFVARASSLTTTCGANSTTLTGDNISSSCSVIVNNATYSTTASVSASASEISASVFSDGPGNNLANDAVLGELYASAYFSVDETWLITGGTGSAELDFNSLPYPYGTLPPFLTTLSAQPPGDVDGDAVANVTGLPYVVITDGNIDGVRADPVVFTFGVPFSFVLNVGMFADDGFIDGGWASAGVVLGTQTYTIPNANTVNNCTFLTCLPRWEIYQPGSNFESATLIMTAVDASTPEPSFAGPLLILLLALALWRYRHAVRRRFMAFHS